MSDDGVSAWLEQELEQCRAAYDAGAKVAVADGLRLCLEFDAKAPPWLLSAASDAVLETLGAPSHRVRRRGRNANSAAQYRSAMIDFERWSTVKDVRERQNRNESALKEEIKRDPKSALIARGLKIRQQFGKTWPQAYAKASSMLATTFAQGSAAAMKKSYDDVQRDVAEGNARKYHIPRYRENQWLLE